MSGWAVLVDDGQNRAAAVAACPHPVSTVLAEPTAAALLLVTGQVDGVWCSRRCDQLYSGLRVQSPESYRPVLARAQSRPRWTSA